MPASIVDADNSATPLDFTIPRHNPNEVWAFSRAYAQASIIAEGIECWSPLVAMVPSHFMVQVWRAVLSQAALDPQSDHCFQGKPFLAVEPSTSGNPRVKFRPLAFTTGDVPLR